MEVKWTMGLCCGLQGLEKGSNNWGKEFRG